MIKFVKSGHGRTKQQIEEMNQELNIILDCINNRGPIKSHEIYHDLLELQLSKRALQDRLKWLVRKGYIEYGYVSLKKEGTL
jgi:Mn-dependent DtxR family transcriptional regulator